MKTLLLVPLLGGIARFRDTDPEFVTPGLPPALRASVRTATYDEAIDGATAKRLVFPDWSNSEVTAFVCDFYKRFGAEFDRDPALAFVQVGFGLWGEYHLDFDNLRDGSDPSIRSVADALGPLHRRQRPRLRPVRESARTNRGARVRGL